MKSGVTDMENDWIVQMSVGEFLRRWPEAVPIFIAHRMLCVGCPMAPFDTMEDVAFNYHLDLQDFLTEVSRAAHGGLTPALE
ncbi:MAG TPA: DUF1858 domain-containing protein [Anaerolineaceae bacterium]